MNIEHCEFYLTYGLKLHCFQSVLNVKRLHVAYTTTLKLSGYVARAALTFVYEGLKQKIVMIKVIILGIDLL